MLADGDRDVAPGAAELVGDLHARRRRADHEHVAVARELRRPPVLERGELLDARRGSAGRERRDARVRSTRPSPRRRRRTATCPASVVDVEAVVVRRDATRR